MQDHVYPEEVRATADERALRRLEIAKADIEKLPGPLPMVCFLIRRRLHIAGFDLSKPTSRTYSLQTDSFIFKQEH